MAARTNTKSVKEAYGAGSIREVRPGVWLIRVSGGVDPVTGQRVRIVETFHGGPKEAQQRRGALANMAGGTVPTNATLGEMVDAWLATGRRADGKAPLGEQTLATYRNSLVHLSDTMRAKSVRKITSHELAKFYATLLATEKARGGRGVDEHGKPRVFLVGPEAVSKLHTVLCGAFTWGVRNGWATVNVARGAGNPVSSKRRTDKYVRAAVLSELLDAARMDGDATQGLELWLTLHATTGARCGEVLALRWDDVDLAAGTVTIRHNLVRRTRQLTTTKTDNVRTVSIDPATVALLEAQRHHQRELRLALGAPAACPWVLHDEPRRGEIPTAPWQPWRPDTASGRFTRLLRLCGYTGEHHLHDVRHSVGTYLVAAGVPLPLVAQQLGHSRTSTTADFYSGVVADARNAGVMRSWLDTATADAAAGGAR